MNDIRMRKEEHIRLAMDIRSQGETETFSSYQLPVKTLPEMDLKEVDTSVSLWGKRLKQPLIVASMTGGIALGEKINGNLATACEECGVALGVGSQRAALEKPEVRESFKIVRKNAPKTLVFANMGAVQLNYGRTWDDYRRVAEMVDADGLYLHLNAVQEALQPEGDTNFKFLISKIQVLIKNIKIPVFVKEVGCGVDRDTAKRLIEIGAAGVDVAGTGGTSWTWIEGKRSGSENLTGWFKDWGISTEDALKSAVRARGKRQVKIIASGGIRNPIQGLKAHLLGADLYSAARPFLHPALENDEEVIKVLKDWEKGLRVAMFGCGIKKW